ncbi:MAG: hypothetical protein HXX14_15205 [Bacteroidetes bacterium]|nr:hypothetical protein [Bacteroidota bacterium]
MKKQVLTSIAILIAAICFGQSDTIFSNNQKIACSVKELTPDAVKYTYPGEDLINSIYKNSVQKIVFKNGRVQTFAEATSYKTVASVNDYENVTITQVEGEVKGLFKIGDVSSKAKGTTTLSNQERVKERAYKKLKIQAAMMGANIIYLTNQRTEGNKMGGYFQSGSTAETNLTGIAYTNQLPDIEDFKKIIADKRDFQAVFETKLWSSASDMSLAALENKFTISEITNENGLIMIKGQLEGVSSYSKFRVVSFTKEFFNIFYEDKSTVYNIRIQL